MTMSQYHRYDNIKLEINFLPQTESNKIEILGKGEIKMTIKLEEFFTNYFKFPISFKTYFKKFRHFLKVEIFSK